jgi:hypothetical protein
MANEKIGLVDATTGAGVADADARYVQSVAKSISNTDAKATPADLDELGYANRHDAVSGVVVEGAGEVTVNGAYEPDGDYNGNPSYKKGDLYIWYSAPAWYLNDEKGGTSSPYYAVIGPVGSLIGTWDTSGLGWSAPYPGVLGAPVLVKHTWLQLLVSLKTYFDTLYNNYVLPKATADVLGGVKQGTGVTIDGDGVISATGGGGSTDDAIKAAWAYNA